MSGAYAPLSVGWHCWQHAIQIRLAAKCLKGISFFRLAAAASVSQSLVPPSRALISHAQFTKRPPGYPYYGWSDSGPEPVPFISLGGCDFATKIVYLLSGQLEDKGRTRVEVEMLQSMPVTTAAPNCALKQCLMA